MNFAKGGQKNTGKGASFKKALQYYLHDKRPEGQTGPHPESSERVGFVVMENLPPCNPAEAWREMKFLASAADHIKVENARAAAIEAGTDPEAAAKKARAGRKCTQPLYVYSLNWHRDDAPSDADMLAAARETLALLGLQDHQAVIVQHIDQQHRHVHIAVNRVNPDTGIANPLSNDEFKLDEWAFNYEIERGQVRSPDRYMKHMEAMRKKDPARFAAIVAARLPGAPEIERGKGEPAKKERKERNHQQRGEWQAKKAAENDNNPAKEEAAAIKKRFNDEWRNRKQAADAAEARRVAERNAAWKLYQKERAALWDAYKPQIDRHWQRPRRGQLSALQRVRAFIHDPAGTLRDERDRQEWKRFGRRQWQERRAFEARERTLTGAIANAIRLLRVSDRTLYRGRLSGVFHLTRNADERKRLFDLQQEAAKKALRDRQAARKKLLSDPIKAKRDEDLQRLATAYNKRRDEIDARHAGERAAEKARRAASNLERARAWEAWRERFKIKPREGYTKDAPNDRPTTRPIFNRAGEKVPPREGGKAFTAFRDAANNTRAPSPSPNTGTDEKAGGKAFTAFRDHAAGLDQSPDRERTKPGPGDKPPEPPKKD